MDFHLVQIAPVGLSNVAVVQQEGAAGRIHLIQAEKIVVPVVLEVWHAGTDAFLVVHVNLTESAIDAFGLPDVFVLVVDFPAGNGHAAANEWVFPFVGFVAHVVAVLAAIALVKGDGGGKGVGSGTEDHLDVTGHGSVNGAHRLFCLLDCPEGGFLGSLVGVAALGRNVECGLCCRMGGNGKS